MRDILVKPVDPGQDALSREDNFSVVRTVWNERCLNFLSTWHRRYTTSK